MLRAERQLRTCLSLKLLGLIGLTCLLVSPGLAQQLGAFEGHADIGDILHPGNASFDPETDAYTVTGSGDNLWFTADDMQFAWKRVHGDLAITAEIAFVGEKGNMHRKAALMLRQSLDPNSPYADVARHGDGLTSLQFRLSRGEVTREVETAVKAPRWAKIEKRGDLVTVAVGDSPDSLHYSGASIHLNLTGGFYVGLAVCSHDKSVTETAIFRHVQITPLPTSTGSGRLWSTLETVKVASSDRRVAYTVPQRIAAPNWSRSGTAITFEQNGTLQRFDLDPAPYPSLNAQSAFSKQAARIQTGIPFSVAPVYGISPDGKQLAFSAERSGQTQLFLVPAEGGVPQEVHTQVPIALWHSWSPDGRNLAFTGLRAGQAAVYTVPVKGGETKEPTNQPGNNQDPDFSPDGEWIYFSSDRTGHAQLWRMHPDGSGPEQILTEETDNIAPHPSPDGKWIVYLALLQGSTINNAESLAELRLFSVADHTSRYLAQVLAGAGTLPVPSWSPDSSRVAFISYAHLP